MSTRILVADDHFVVRAGLKALLESEPDLRIVAEAVDGHEAVACHAEHSPDLTLMDLRMPGLNGFEATEAIRRADPRARIIVLTTYRGDADIYRALEAGACGYLLKETVGHEVVDAVRAALAGRRVIPAAVAMRLADYTPRVDLTEREVQVLRYAFKGLRNREIARVIMRADETVKVHLKHIVAKLGASDRTSAVVRALQRGIIHADD